MSTSPTDAVAAFRQRIIDQLPGATPDDITAGLHASSQGVRWSANYWLPMIHGRDVAGYGDTPEEAMRALVESHQRYTIEREIRARVAAEMGARK